jgi:aspartate ammonia-lyase
MKSVCPQCDTTVALASQAGQLELNVMMPVIAHNLFEMMQVMTGSIQAFTLRCVNGITANPDKTEHWLAHNAILITALNPIIGYKAGAELVKEALEKNLTICDTAVGKARQGQLKHQESGKEVSIEEVEAIFRDIRRFTEGGIISAKKDEG